MLRFPVLPLLLSSFSLLKRICHLLQRIYLYAFIGVEAQAICNDVSEDKTKCSNIILNAVAGVAITQKQRGTPATGKA